MNDGTEAVDLSNASDDDLKSMGLPPSFTLEQLQSFMSEEEIERELESDDSIVAKADREKMSAAGKANEEAGDPEEDDPEGEEAGGGDTVKGEGDDPDEDDPDEDEDAGDDDPAPVVLREPDPVYQPVDVAQHQKVIDGMAEARKAAHDAYNDGDLTDAEYQKKLDTLADELAEARSAVKLAERDNSTQLKKYQETWYERSGAVMEAVPAFKDVTPVAALGGYSVAQVFDQACRLVTTDAKFAHLSLTEKADQAKNIASAYYKQQTGNDLAAGKPAKKADAPIGKKAEKTPAEKAKEQGARPKPVQTLGGLSSASETEVNGGKFAVVDAKSGIDGERAYASMSEAEKEAYLAG
jgi:hypothetical protein